VQAVTVARDHGVEVVDRRIHVHGAHAIEITVRRGEGLDALLEIAGRGLASGFGCLVIASVNAGAKQILPQQPNPEGAVGSSSTRLWGRPRQVLDLSVYASIKGISQTLRSAYF
jgi:hypothetical protein